MQAHVNARKIGVRPRVKPRCLQLSRCGPDQQAAESSQLAMLRFGIIRWRRDTGDVEVLRPLNVADHADANDVKQSSGGTGAPFDAHRQVARRARNSERLHGVAPLGV